VNSTDDSSGCNLAPGSHSSRLPSADQVLVPSRGLVLVAEYYLVGPPGETPFGFTL